MSCKEAIGYAKFNSRSHHAVIRVYDEAGNVNATHEHASTRPLVQPSSARLCVWSSSDAYDGTTERNSAPETMPLTRVQSS